MERLNEQIVPFRECLIDKGWDYPELVPDENGLLGTGSEFPSPPGGTTAFGSGALDDCGFSQLGEGVADDA